MDFGPDGSLRRITSTAKDCVVNNVRIVKVSEEELLESGGPSYKLVLIGEDEDDIESKTSDEEIIEAEEPNLEIRTANIVEGEATVQETVNIGTVQETVKDFKPSSETCPEKTFRKPYHRSNNTQQDRSRKRHSFPSKRNFNSAGNATKSYNRPVSSTSNDISPYPLAGIWDNPPPELQYAMYGQHQSMLNSPGEFNSDKPYGLLGDFPYPPFSQHNFPSNIQSNHFNQAYYNDVYSNDYQRSTQDAFISNQPYHRKYESWKSSEQRNRKGGRKNDRYFHNRK